MEIAKRITKISFSIADPRPPETPKVCMASSARKESHQLQNSSAESSEHCPGRGLVPVMGTEGTQAEKGLEASK